MTRDTKAHEVIWILRDNPSLVLEKAVWEDLPIEASPMGGSAQALESDDDNGPQVLVSDIGCRAGPARAPYESEGKTSRPAVIIMTAFSDLTALCPLSGRRLRVLPSHSTCPRRRADPPCVQESQREEVAEERMAAAPEMLGQAPAMQDVFRAIGRLSQSNVTVLIR